MYFSSNGPSDDVGCAVVHYDCLVVTVFAKDVPFLGQHFHNLQCTQ